MVTDIAYFFVMKGIQLWKALTYLVVYLCFKPLKNLIVREFQCAKVEINGKAPQDLVVHNEMFYHRICQDGILGFAEAYMDGWFDCDSVDEFFYRMIHAGFYKKYYRLPWHKVLHYLEFELFNKQTAKRSWEVGQKHYDIGNALFESFLDPSMNYSCGYWKDAKNLNEAQQHKMELIARKLKLEPGMRVLDIGCGWGGLCHYLAKNYNVKVVGVTVSVEGAAVARERCAGLPVEIRAQDYRDVNEKFDRIVSVGMFEHVGRKNYRTFFQMAHRCLTNHGIFLLHTIGMDSDKVPSIEPFFNTYIFPNGELPYHTNIAENCDKLFSIEDWHNFGADYDRTLMAWKSNFVKNWPSIEHLFEDSRRFFRLWTFYLGICAGSFRSRRTHLWQIVLSRNGVPGGYTSVR